MNDQRQDFEAWLRKEHDLDAEWQPERNCYKEFAAHLAYKAWCAARQLPSDQTMWDIAAKTSGAVLVGWNDEITLDIRTPEQLREVVLAVLKDANDEQE